MKSRAWMKRMNYRKPFDQKRSKNKTFSIYLKTS